MYLLEQQSFGPLSVDDFQSLIQQMNQVVPKPGGCLDFFLFVALPACAHLP